MAQGSPVEIGLKIAAAVDYANTLCDEDVRPHYLHTVGRITDDVGLDDLTTAELVSLTALLIPAHSRVITGRTTTNDPATTRRALRLIGGAVS